MAVSFTSLTLGAPYERLFLAELWGYKGWQAIGRGVVTPAGSKYIIFFVTEKKQSSLTQYEDFLDDGRLHWEGEDGHGNDRRIVAAGYGPDEIYLFHRKVHHSPFTYFGRIYLEQHNLRKRAPSQFIFFLASVASTENSGDTQSAISLQDIGSEQATERAAISASRIGQGVFRDGLLRLWQGCAVSGYERPEVLIASHIKPWRKADNIERLDPYNGLLLQPNLDKLFDIGLITFSETGELIKADHIKFEELSTLGIRRNSRLKSLPELTAQYLEYHRRFCFGSG